MDVKNSTDLKHRMLHRLKIARGQTDTVIEMIENEKYCVDIINQSRAVQNAMREIDYLLLGNHLQTCVVNFAKSGKTKDSIEEIMRLFKNSDK